MNNYSNQFKGQPTNKDLSKLELNQNNKNLLNKIYFYPGCKQNIEIQKYPNSDNFREKNNILNNNYILNINNKNNKTLNNNIDNNEIKVFDNNENKDINVAITQSQKDEPNISIIIRNQFVKKVYGILLTQFIITFGLILICQIKIIKNYLNRNRILYIILMILAGLIFAGSFAIMTCYPSFLKKVPKNYIFLFLFTICETILLVYVSILYSFIYILGAISFVTIIVTTILLISCFKKISMKFFYIFFIISLGLGIMYGILIIIFRNYYLQFFFCLIGAIIFTIFLIFDTQSISQDENFITIDDYIFAALILYTDIIRIFIQILKIIGMMKGGRSYDRHE